VDVRLCLETPAEVSFVLAPEGQLTGIVREGARPASRISVLIKKEEEAFPLLASSSADAQGRYTFRDLPEGHYSVQVFEATVIGPNRARSKLRWTGEVEIAEGQKKDFDIDLDADSAEYE
jgi:hypothetical protein